MTKREHRIGLFDVGRWASALGIGLATALAVATPAVAVPTVPGQAIFDMTLGSNFNNGAGVALGTNSAIYTAAQGFVVAYASGSGANIQDLDIAGMTQPGSIPTVTIPLDPTFFRFTILSNPMLTYDTSNGEINEMLTDALIGVKVERVAGATIVNQDTYMVPFTTGTVSLPACGGAPARDVTGAPVVDTDMDGWGDAVTLIGAVCMVNFGTSMNFDTPLQFRFDGDLPLVPEPAAASIGLVSVAMLAALARARSQRA